MIPNLVKWDTRVSILTVRGMRQFGGHVIDAK